MMFRRLLNAAQGEACFFIRILIIGYGIAARKVQKITSSWAVLIRRIIVALGSSISAGTIAYEAGIGVPICIG